MASINTNVGALVAAQSLSATGRDLATVQNRVSTGLKVSSAKDNGAVFAIATNQRANLSALDATINNLQRSQSVNDVGLAAGDSVIAGLTELKGLAAAIASGAGDTSAYEADYTAIAAEIATAITGATFDGTSALAITYTLNAAATATEANVQLALDAALTAVQTLGTTSKSLDRQITFNSKLQDALETGIGNLVDADLAKESARLTALQTKQQLGVQALSIANSSSQTLLGLFR